MDPSMWRDTAVLRQHPSAGGSDGAMQEVGAGEHTGISPPETILVSGVALRFFVFLREVNGATPDGDGVGRAQSLHYDSNSRLVPTSSGVPECVRV